MKDKKSFVNNELAKIASDTSEPTAQRLEALSQLSDDGYYAAIRTPLNHSKSIHSMAVFLLKGVVAAIPAATLVFVLYVASMVFVTVTSQLVGGL